MKKCDFCSAENPEHVYDAVSHVVGCEVDGVAVELGRSVDGWMACDDCARLIDAGDWEGLIRHAYDRVCVPLGIEWEFGETLLRQMHAQFRKHQSASIAE